MSEKKLPLDCNSGPLIHAASERMRAEKWIHKKFNKNVSMRVPRWGEGRTEAAFLWAGTKMGYYTISAVICIIYMNV